MTIPLVELVKECVIPGRHIELLRKAKKGENNALNSYSDLPIVLLMEGGKMGIYLTAGQLILKPVVEYLGSIIR